MEKELTAALREFSVATAADVRCVCDADVMLKNTINDVGVDANDCIEKKKTRSIELMITGGKTGRVGGARRERETGGKRDQHVSADQITRINIWSAS